MQWHQGLHNMLDVFYTQFGEVPSRITISPSLRDKILRAWEADRRFMVDGADIHSKDLSYWYRNSIIQFEVLDNPEDK